MKIKILSRPDLEQVLEMPSVIEGVRSVYRLKAAGETEVWPLVAYDFLDQGAVMDIRSGAVLGSEQLHGLKMLNNFPRNREKGLPTFTGMLMIFDSTTGLPLGVMDASYVTGMRTGAAGAVEAMVSVLSVKNDIIPPTINHDDDDRDEEIDYDLNFTFNKAQKRTVRAAMSNTFGFGGHNACVIFKKYDD